MKFPKKNLLILLFIVGFGEWFISDIVHFSGGSLGFLILCFGGYTFFKNEQPKFHEPNDLNGWIKLCNDDLKVLEEFEGSNKLLSDKVVRNEIFTQILNKDEQQKFTIIKDNDSFNYIDLFKKYFSKNNYELNFVNQLPSLDPKNLLPEFLLKNDAIFYHLKLPLTAKGLLWLEKLPKDMPIWLMVSSLEDKTLKDELIDEIPQNFKNKLLYIEKVKNNFTDIPFSFRKFILNLYKNVENSKKRSLKQLHTNWQAEIESIRRVKLKNIQSKNQIFVAASVFASPIPSIDVLSMTVLNSLMINEIKEIWGCNWSPEMLEKISKQILKTAITQGVIEWSSQTLMGLSKFHGPNWLVAGALQAVSAAYLTRVVSRSLADFMAISKGVTEPDLEFIKSNSDKIVNNAFESEKINWKSLISELKTPLKLKFD
tara:strand:- start:9 stop:1289 length:1281 start_codon:yes stop_codon:yes gene_type:complete